MTVIKRFPMSAMQYLVNPKDLEELGWTLSDEDLTGYLIEVIVQPNGYTEFSTVNEEKYKRGIWEGSDYEATGDDRSTIDDLRFLEENGKIIRSKELEG